MIELAVLLPLNAECGSAAQPVLHLPLQCQLGKTCYIQNYIDHDPGPGWHDYACGSLTYDGHNGTDFSLPNVRMMWDGVNVLAAAPGTVVAIRDGEPDISIRQRGSVALAGKDAGNSVRIRHDGDWETQYSHMKKGSIAVRVGQKVETGATLGQVGLSGNTEFPHIHFSVRYQGHDIDPFSPNRHECGPGDAGSLWDPSLKKALRYTPTGLLNAGFSSEVPQREKVDACAYASDTFAPDAPAMVFWIVMFGIRQGDSVELSLHDPAKKILCSEQKSAAGNQAMLFAFLGKRLVTNTWPSGIYTGRVVLRRGKAMVLDTTHTIRVGEVVNREQGGRRRS